MNVIEGNILAATPGKRHILDNVYSERRRGNDPSEKLSCRDDNDQAG
jgi:hypothetical protein